MGIFKWEQLWVKIPWSLTPSYGRVELMVIPGACMMAMVHAMIACVHACMWYDDDERLDLKKEKKKKRTDMLILKGVVDPC